MKKFAYKKSAFASLLVLPLLLSAGRALAESFPLDSIDFVSEGRHTNIIFHTGSIVPVQKVLVSSDKLMIDIDQIDATQTIRTNFTGADNISHVIIQPVNDHKVRLIIRGNGLSNPSVAFDRISAADEYVNQSSLSAPASDVDSLAPLPLEKAAPPKAAKVAPKATEALDTAMALGDEENTPFPSIAGPEKKSPVSLPAETSKRPVSTQSSFNTEKAAQPASDMPFSDLPWLQAIPVVALALALGGAGFLLRNKWSLLRGGASPDVSVDIEESWPGTERPRIEIMMEQPVEKTGERLNRRQSFREMADSYRRQNAGHASETEMPARKSHPEDVIGLKSLANVDDEFDLLSTPAPTRAPKAPRVASPVSQPNRPAIQSKKPAAPEQLSLEDILAAMQKNQPPAPAKKKMPNPYTPPQASQAKAKTAPVLKAGSPTIQKATAPQNTQSNTPVNRAAAAKKAVAAPKAPVSQPTRARQQAEQGPVAGNPEVLNFLRNVADLMEKDGQPAIAQNIHRNLGASPKAGLAR